ncbi:FAD-dependent monooxygenase [Mangrovihabitans endophyticus]|uniref:FAD-dependent oxidoreductase n=1 Tax=Mangrovihabitans endophyticus TaxID=1751298 RepID=A0A8J3FRB5_9ACTN|nr:FAD-dependent monooxygenase [Mangrovihabitans endophyticus]GGL04994.1 FAD-dependent oxidoreductase [Mangrovihabitans endophyticus]
MHQTSRGKILISGASIAGPALAFWLSRYGFRVTVVEKAPTVRGGGYPIDIRGTALQAVDRMGLLPELRAAHIDTRRLTFMDGDGSRVASLRPEAMTGGASAQRDIELPRGDLTASLFRAARDNAEFRFDDSIATLADQPDGVDVTFRSGISERYDVVVGADGLHSHTRGLVMGPEEPFHRYLGYCFAGFTMPNVLGLAHEGVMWNVPGKGAVMYAVGESPQVHGFLTFARPEPPFAAFRNPQAQRDLIAATFAGLGWHVPRMVAAMHEADDLFFDVVSQIHLPRWSAGRVVLIGDAAHAPSFLAGQGSSLALVDAYMLAHAMATHQDHATAFSAYEKETRDFVSQNQALVTVGDVALLPRTPEALEQRHEMLRRLSALPPDGGHPEYTALTLPEPALS